MEYALRVTLPQGHCDDNGVLILVLMEYALRESKENEKEISNRLNPCFNGICSAS